MIGIPSLLVVTKCNYMKEFLLSIYHKIKSCMLLNINFKLKKKLKRFEN